MPTTRWLLASIVNAGIVVLALIAGQGETAAHSNFAAGVPGDPAKPAREVRIIMAEDGKRMLFDPPSLVVEHGEQVRFTIYNDGFWDHELMLDSFAGNAKHKKAMLKNPEMVHDDPNGVTVSPAATGAILWRFTKLGTFEYACLLPGHYEAGMKGIVKVVAKSKGKPTGGKTSDAKP